MRLFGRIFEAGMIGVYNVWSGHFTKDVAMAPKMLLKGKLSLLPPRAKDGGELRKMFDRVRALEGKLE